MNEMGYVEWTYIAGLFSAGDVGQFWPDRIIFFRVITANVRPGCV